MAAGALLLLAAIMLSTVGDYGITGDEAVRNRYGRKLIRWYTSLGADRAAVANVDISRDGGLFEITTGLAQAISPLEVYATRHVVVVAFGLIAFASVYGIGGRLAGPAAGFSSLVFLALTSPFYGHAFNNPKDVPFAAMFALAAAAVLRAGQDWDRWHWGRIAGAGVAIGLVAGERVAGLVFLAYAPALWLAVLWLESGARDNGSRTANRLKRLGGAWLVTCLLAWVVMLAFWPWAQTQPLANPLQAMRMFSRFWDCMVVFFDGQYACSGLVSRFYLPTWFSLTLPETYLVAFVLGLLVLARLLRSRPMQASTQVRLLQTAWLSSIAAVPALWAVAAHTPLYDGLRHFLFVMPPLAVLAGASTATFFRTAGRAPRIIAGVALAATGGASLVDMIQLHPYQAVYFNRLVAGGLERAITRYEGDYWCLSYKEGAEWLQRRYSGAACRERIRVAGHSTLQQTQYYFPKSAGGQGVFRAVDVTKGDPHFVMTTTRFGDHLRTPGRLVHQVKRQHAAL
ncbi:MAG TPA: glycosyltransferase family 39 protein, partial [Vicinamibacteria bacterium]